MAGNILELTLKKKWFDMISSGEKKEEYREIKWHWVARLMILSVTDWVHKDQTVIDLQESGLKKLDSFFKGFAYVRFTHGYKKDAPKIVFECKGIEVGTGKPEWGAEPGEKYFIIKLGKETTNP